MPQSLLLPGAPAGLAAARLRNADAFLATRGLDRGVLDRLLDSKTGEARHHLLTSSAVHGLANATSDLDFIRVQEQSVSGARMATQLFEEGQHMESITFGDEEVAEALAELESAAREEPARVVAAYRRWDKSRELRRKYLERLVNGVALDGTSPYVHHTPALARMWKWASLQTAVEQVFYLRLAEAAGETRGRAGYALGALLHLMDAALSHHGDVYSNRKWYLLRWQRFLASGAADAPLATLGERFAELGAQVTDVLARRSDRPLASGFTALLDEAFGVVGEGREPALVLEPVGDTPRMRFLPGADLVLGRSGFFLGEGPLPEGTVRTTAGEELPGDPAGVLGALRAGALRVSPA
jgi:hypothetical protein